MHQRERIGVGLTRSLLRRPPSLRLRRKEGLGNLFLSLSPKINYTPNPLYCNLKSLLFYPAKRCKARVFMQYLHLFKANFG